MSDVVKLCRFVAGKLPDEVQLGGALRVVIVSAAQGALREAADEIERLRAGVDRWRAVAGAAQEDEHRMSMLCCRMEDQRDEARAIARRWYEPEITRGPCCETWTADAATVAGWGDDDE